MAGLIPGRTAEYRKRLTNPGRRSTIPDEYLKALNPNLYAKRQANTAAAQRTTRNNALYDPTRMLSGSEIYSLAKQQASGAYDPLISDAVTQRRLAIVNDAALGERIAGYNQMASKALADAHEAAQSGAKDLADRLAATRTGTLGAIDSDAAKSQQFAQDDAALRGGDVTAGMSQRLTQDFQAQRAGVAANLAAQENTGNVAGEGWKGLVTMMQGAQAMRGADQLAQVATAGANREFGLQQDIDKLKAAKLTDPQNGLEANINRLRQSEFEKGAAIKTLGIKQQSADAAANKPAPETTYDKETSKWAAKLGLTPNEFMKLGPNGRAKQIDAYNRRQHPRKAGSSEKPYSSGAFAGLTPTEVTNMNTKQRQQKIDQYNSVIHPGKAGEKADPTMVGGVKQQSTLQQSKASATVSHTVKGVLPSIKSGRGIENPNYDPKDKNSKKYIVPPKKGGYSRHEAAAILQRDPNSPSPALISAALDMAYNIPPHISKGTAAKLHQEGYSVRSLGLPVNRTISENRPN
jgi:hypothetical protein